MPTSQPDNHYQQHLLNLCSQSRLLAKIPIHSESGTLLCGIDESLSEHAFAVLLQTEGWLGLPRAIYGKNELTDVRLSQILKGFIATDASFQGLMCLETHEQQLNEFCKFACRDDTLRLRLTVLWMVYPIAFDRCLFCAAFGFLVYLERQKNVEELRDIFVTGLFHEIGLLDIENRLQYSEQRISAEDNYAYYQHSLLGAAELARSGYCSKTVVEAVAQHHEQMDGTGFPKALQGLSLSEAAQVIHLLNNLYMVYEKYFKPRRRTLTDTIPIIEMNSVSRFGAIAKSVIQVLERGKRSLVTDLTEDFAKPVIQAVRDRYLYIGQANLAIENFTRTVGFRHDNRELFNLQNGFIHITMALMKSTNINEGYMRWLDQVEECKLQHAYQEIEDTFLMMNEVIYHIEKFKKQLKFYCSTCKDPRVKTCVEETLAALSRCELPNIKKMLSAGLNSIFNDGAGWN